MSKNKEDYSTVTYSGTSLATGGTYVTEWMPIEVPHIYQTLDYAHPTLDSYKQLELAYKAKKSVHFSSAKGDWRTPKSVLEWLKPFGNIELDPSASSHVEEQFAALNYTIETNGLDKSWETGLVYCNPPYGRKIGLWTDKAVAEAGLGAEIIMLLPARPDTAWWQRMVKSANAVCFVKGRIKFEGAPHCAPFPSALVYFGARSTLFVDSMAARGWCIQS